MHNIAYYSYFMQLFASFRGVFAHFVNIIQNNTYIYTAHNRRQIIACGCVFHIIKKIFTAYFDNDFSVTLIMVAIAGETTIFINNSMRKFIPTSPVTM